VAWSGNVGGHQKLIFMFYIFISHTPNVPNIFISTFLRMVTRLVEARKNSMYLLKVFTNSLLCVTYN